jgi:hypothetical protein
MSKLIVAALLRRLESKTQHGQAVPATEVGIACAL